MSRDRRVELRRYEDTQFIRLRKHFYVAIAILTVLGATALGLERHDASRAAQRNHVAISEVQRSRQAACTALNARIARIGDSIEAVVHGAPAQQRAQAERALAPLFSATKPEPCPTEP